MGVRRLLRTSFLATAAVMAGGVLSGTLAFADEGSKGFIEYKVKSGNSAQIEVKQYTKDGATGNKANVVGTEDHHLRLEAAKGTVNVTVHQGSKSEKTQADKVEVSGLTDKDGKAFLKSEDGNITLTVTQSKDNDKLEIGTVEAKDNLDITVTQSVANSEVHMAKVSAVDGTLTVNVTQESKEGSKVLLGVKSDGTLGEVKVGSGNITVTQSGGNDTVRLQNVGDSTKVSSLTINATQSGSDATIDLVNVQGLASLTINSDSGSFEQTGSNASVTLNDVNGSGSLTIKGSQGDNGSLTMGDSSQVTVDGTLTIDLTQDSTTKGTSVSMNGTTVESTATVNMDVDQSANDDKVVVKGSAFDGTATLSLNIDQDNSNDSVKILNSYLGDGTFTIEQSGDNAKVVIKEDSDIDNFNNFTISQSGTFDSDNDDRGVTFKGLHAGTVTGKIVQKNEDGETDADNELILSDSEVSGTLTFADYDGSTDNGLTMEGNDNTVEADSIRAENLNMYVTMTGDDNLFKIAQETAKGGNITNKVSIDGDENKVKIAQISVADNNDISVDVNLTGNENKVRGADSDGTIDETTASGVKQVSTATDGDSKLIVTATGGSDVGITQIGASAANSDGYANYAKIEASSNSTIGVYQDARSGGYNMADIKATSNDNITVVQVGYGNHIWIQGEN